MRDPDVWLPSGAPSTNLRVTASSSSVAVRDRVFILTCLAAVTALSWAYLVHLSRHPSSAEEYARMMAEMGMAVDRPWTLVDAVLTFAMWAVMMMGMMTGSAAPLVILYANAQSKRHKGSVVIAALTLSAGYLAVWFVFSAIATLTQWWLQRLALLYDPMSAARPIVAGTILAIAGFYQLTPLKYVCLAACRSPLGFLMTNWRDGKTGAFIMGTRHGIFCLGCCWALMIVLFAVGVMNLTWVAALTGVVLLEKLAPGGVWLSRITGVALLAAASYLVLNA